MSTGEDAASARARTTGWPVLSALFIAGAGYFVLVRGVGSVPPFFALLLVGAGATVLFRLLDQLRGVFNNFIVAGLSGIALMLSMIPGIAAIAWALWMILGTAPSPIERWQAAASTTEAIGPATLLFMCLLLGFLGLAQAAALWSFVRANAFGPRRPDAREGHETDER